jgi:cytochrome c biogenesis factor
MIVAHLGIATFIIGVTMVKGYETERDVRMAVGDTVTVGGFTLRFRRHHRYPRTELPRRARDLRREPERAHVTTQFPRSACTTRAARR